jgi:glycosyltransferase involved in cell wall biosynthesis
VSGFSDAASNYPVAVIMNYFTGHEYLADSLASLELQGTNFTLYFIDNRSMVDPKPLLERFRGSFPIRYFRLEEHKLLYEARNVAVQETTEPYLAFLDVDDIWQSGKLERQLGHMVASGADLSFTGFRCFREKGRERRNVRTISKRYKQPVSADELAQHYSVAMSSIMVSREALDQLGGFDPSYEIIGDFDLVMRAAETLTVTQLTEKMVEIRLHSQSTGHVSRGKQALELADWLKIRGSKMARSSQISGPVEAEIRLLEYISTNEISLQVFLRVLWQSRSWIRALALVRIAMSRFLRQLNWASR